MRESERCCVSEMDYRFLTTEKSKTHKNNNKKMFNQLYWNLMMEV